MTTFGRRVVTSSVAEIQEDYAIPDETISLLMSPSIVGALDIIYRFKFNYPFKSPCIFFLRWLLANVYACQLNDNIFYLEKYIFNYLYIRKIKCGVRDKNIFSKYTVSWKLLKATKLS